jgi:hypothetical protein
VDWHLNLQVLSPSDGREHCPLLFSWVGTARMFASFVEIAAKDIAKATVQRNKMQVIFIGLNVSILLVNLSVI